jgi:hypothetical protein
MTTVWKYDAISGKFNCTSGTKWTKICTLPASFSIRGCIQKFPDWVDNEINNNQNKHSLRNNTKGYGCKTQWTDSQNSDKTTPSGRELYHLQSSLYAASPETIG